MTTTGSSPRRQTCHVEISVLYLNRYLLRTTQTKRDLTTLRFLAWSQTEVIFLTGLLVNDTGTFGPFIWWADLGTRVSSAMAQLGSSGEIRRRESLGGGGF